MLYIFEFRMISAFQNCSKFENQSNFGKWTTLVYICYILLNPKNLCPIFSNIYTTNHTSFAVNLVKNANRDSIVSLQWLHRRLKWKKMDIATLTHSWIISNRYQFRKSCQKTLILAFEASLSFTFCQLYPHGGLVKTWLA